MSRRRVVGVVVLGLALVIGALFWHRSRSTAKPANATTSKQAGNGRAVPTIATTQDPTAQKRIAGTVFLETAPAPGASVRLVEGRAGTERVVQADASGHFDFGSVLIGQYSVIAEVPRARGALAFVDLRNPVAVPASDQLRLVAHSCEAIVHGVIRDASGGTVAKAHVMVARAFMGGPGVDSNDDGTYELCVSIGDSGILVRADGYADAEAGVAAYGKIRRDFDLVPEAVVAGRTVRADDGTPVPNARVTLVASRPGFGRVGYFTAMSDDDGRFRFRGVGRGQFSVRASASHLMTADPIEVTTDVAAPIEDIECKLSTALSIAGRVIDKSKKPVVGASVTMRPNDSFDFYSADDSAITQTDGSFVFDHLQAGDYTASVRNYALDKTAQRLTLDKKDLTDVVLEVEALGSITGRVTRAGKPVEGADVSARPDTPQPRGEFQSFSSNESDAEGKFTIRGLPAGSYHVYAQSERVGAFTQGPQVTLGPAEAKTGVEVEMELAGSIAGVIVDQNEAPIAGVHIRFSLLKGQDFGQATTGEDGSFRAAALSGGGDYGYEVRPSSESPISLKPADGKRFPPIAVKDGNTQITGVRIKVRYERLAISGRVLTSNGEGAPDVSVSAEQDQRGWAAPMATTDASGAFTIRDLPAGNYTIRAQAATASQRVKDVAAGTKGVELKLPGLGTIEGTLVGFKKVANVMAFMPDPDEPSMPVRATVSGNHFTFTNVPVGAYQIMARSDDGYATGETSVTVGEKASLTLTNKGVGTVEGRVVDDKGSPVAELRCMGGGTRPSMTDSDGKFRIEHVAAGEVQVWCFNQGARASATTSVEAGGTAHVDLVMKPGTPFTRSYSGLTLETQMSDIVVTKVAGPAETAGVKVGDTLKKIGDRGIDGRWGADNVMRMIEGRPPGTALKLSLERNDKDQTIEIKLEAPQAP